MQYINDMTFHAACLFSGYVGSKFPTITSTIIKSKMAQKLNDARCAVRPSASAAKSLTSSLDAPLSMNANATESDPPLPMLQLDEL